MPWIILPLPERILPMGSRGNVLFILLLLMTGAAGAILVAEDRRGRQWPARPESFQRLVGGLGFGPELDLSSCVFGFDPRLDGGRSTDYGSIPARPASVPVWRILFFSTRLWNNNSNGWTRRMMRYLLDISGTGLMSVLLHPLQSAVSVFAVVVVLLPYLVGLGLSQGLQREAEASVQFGADLYVTGNRFGRPVPLPLSALPQLRRLENVREVVPRIVGEVVLGTDHVHAVLVGLPPEHFSDWGDCIEGALPQTRSLNELVIGTSLARRLSLHPGSSLLPFYRNDREGSHLSRVVGVFKPDAPPWQANLILTTFETAAHIFQQRGSATDFLVWCRPDSESAVSRAIEQGLSFSEPDDERVILPMVTARQDLLAVLPRGLLHREGIFNLHFLLAFVVAILVLLVMSGIGRGDRRREIGILKATGWQTDEILLRGLVESFSLSLAGACTALVLAWVWLRVFNGYGVASLFLGGAGAAPDFTVPFQLTPVPALLAFVLAFAVVLAGTLYSCWRAAVTPPREAMR